MEMEKWHYLMEAASQAAFAMLKDMANRLIE